MAQNHSLTFRQPGHRRYWVNLTILALLWARMACSKERWAVTGKVHHSRNILYKYIYLPEWRKLYQHFWQTPCFKKIEKPGQSSLCLSKAFVISVLHPYTRRKPHLLLPHKPWHQKEKWTAPVFRPDSIRTADIVHVRWYQNKNQEVGHRMREIFMRWENAVIQDREHQKVVSLNVEEDISIVGVLMRF